LTYVIKFIKIKIRIEEQLDAVTEAILTRHQNYREKGAYSASSEI
jgi:hypothetical protein